MLHLSHGGMRVDLLDPEADAARLGPRFCWGGFIWQVHDENAGPLLSGPEFPVENPKPFNGQGLPESFRHRTLEGRPLTWRGEEGVALGAGALTGNPAVVTAPCRWQIEPERDRVVFRTAQSAAGFNYALVRTVELAGRELHSCTRLENTGATALNLEWFAHPFFPLRGGVIAAKLPAGTALAPNPGFTLDGRTLGQVRRFMHAEDGHMDRLALPAGEPLRVRLAHPAITHVDFETSFAPSACIVWGNDRTFSIEPYLALDLAPGASRTWSLRYRFGASSGISAPLTNSRSPLAL